MSDEQQHLIEAEVAEFLREHPDFFERHGELLDTLSLSHASGGAVSLIERQVELLREKKAELRQQLNQLNQAARINEELLGRLQRMMLRLIAAPDLDSAIAELEQALRDEFHADAVRLMLFDHPARAEHVERSDPSLQSLDELLQRREPACGRLSGQRMQQLFGERAEELASAVLIPLCRDDDACQGVLAIASIDPQRYSTAMGTVFVAHLGAVIAAVLHTLRQGREAA